MTMAAGTASERPAPILQIDGLSVATEGGCGRVPLLGGVDLEIAPGEVLGVVGASGAGKSMTGAVVIGLLDPPLNQTAGRITFDGKRIDDLPEHAMRTLRGGAIGTIVQDPLTALNPVFTIGRQRVVIALALDVSVQAQILNLIRSLQREHGLTLLFISHNLAVIDHMADEVGVMYLGRIVEQQEKTALFSAPRHPYTRALMEVVQSVTDIGHPRASLAGEIPSPIDPPTGCAFHPRCAFVDPRCRADRPEPSALSTDGTVACHGVEDGRIAA